MVTQNRNKQLTVVNGRLAHVIQMEGNTLFLKLANENIVQMYPVSFPTDDGTIKNSHTSHQGRREWGVWGCDTPPENKLSANEGICRQMKNNIPQNVKLNRDISRLVLKI